MNSIVDSLVRTEQIVVPDLSSHKRLIFAYIAHPVRFPSVAENMALVQKYYRAFVLNNPNVIPVMPWYPSVFALDDSVSTERELGININMMTLYRFPLDAFICLGGHLSEGMKQEIVTYAYIIDRKDTEGFIYCEHNLVEEVKHLCADYFRTADLTISAF